MGASAVALGAFGAHALKVQLRNDSESASKLANWATASHYQLIHSIAILIASAKMHSSPRPTVLPATLFTAGCVLFSGSIYGLVLQGPEKRYSKILGPSTPLG